VHCATFCRFLSCAHSLIGGEDTNKIERKRERENEADFPFLASAYYVHFGDRIIP
jgi:hypothetical protein